jgi:hypothetical protein
LNGYYESSYEKEGEGKGKGTIQFSIPELSPGRHTADFLVWDIYNNSTKMSFSFEVDESVKPNLYEITASPNPARDYVDFRLSHNRPGTILEVRIDVFDFTGRLCWSSINKGSSELFKDFIVKWDLNASSCGRLTPGIYLYRAVIKTKRSKEATKSNKLIILGP